MSCYLRHIQDILGEAGIALTKENRQQVDEAVHQAVGVAYKNCPVTWKKLKEDIKTSAAKRQALVRELKAGLR